jgi:hypothetical protein
MNKQEQTAIEAVAKRFSATWEDGGDSSDVCLKIGGKRVAVDVSTLKWRGHKQGSPAKPHLRFDKVVIGLMERLQGTLAKTVPDGVTVLLTVTAPIRLPSKTAAALEGKIHAVLRRRLAGRNEKDTVNGNSVQIRVLRSESARAPKLIGFVHNPDSDPLLLLDMTAELLELVSAEVGSRATKRTGDRWLVVMSAAEISYLEAYRYICSQLRKEIDCKKILMVFGDGSVELLTE